MLFYFLLKCLAVKKSAAKSLFLLGFFGMFSFSLCLWCFAVLVYFLCIVCFHLYFVTWHINKNRKIISLFGGFKKFWKVFFLPISPFILEITIRSEESLPILYSDSWFLFNIFYISIISWVLGNFQNLSSSSQILSSTA